MFEMEMLKKINEILKEMDQVLMVQIKINEERIKKMKQLLKQRELIHA